MTRDPVCNMDIDENTAVATSMHKGKRYYFCAAACKERFDKEPEKYVKDAGEHAHGRHCC